MMFAIELQTLVLELYGTLECGSILINLSEDLPSVFMQRLLQVRMLLRVENYNTMGEYFAFSKT